MEQNHTPMNDIAMQAYNWGRALPQKTLLEVILRNRWIILASVVVCLFGAAVYLAKSTPIFMSTARLYVEPRGPKIISDSEGVMTQSKNYLFTQSELIKSMPILAQVLSDPAIVKLPTFSSKSSRNPRAEGAGMLFEHVKGKLDEPSDKPDDGVIDNRVLFLKKNLSVSVGSKDDIIAVSFDSPYPKDAAQIVNAVVGSYIEYHASKKQSTASEVLKILYNEKTRRDAELKKCFDAMLAFTRKNGVFSTAPNDQHVVLQRLAKLSDALSDAQMDTIRAEADYNVIVSMADEPEKIRRFAMEQANSGVRFFVEDVEMQLRAEKRGLELEFKAMQRHCTEDHPALKAMQEKMEKIDQQLEQEARNYAETYLEVGRLKWTTAMQKEKELEAAFAVQEEAARDLTVQTAEHYVLDSNLKRTERLCEVLDNRIKEINVTEDVGALNINILETARPAIDAYKPQGRVVMTKALILGLMMGCGLAFLRNVLDSHLRSIDEITATLDLPLVGVVPVMPNKLPVSELGQQVEKEPMSHMAESFRTIRTALYFGVPKDKGQVLLLTSPMPGDGKSSLVSNLAIAMAQSGQKTLVLDADLRKPMQHKIFDFNAKIKGLSVLLAGQCTLSEAIQKGPVEGLDILPCPDGANVPNPSEMLNSTHFSDTVSTLRAQYDRIIIDSPPVLSVADSHILAAMSDTTLLVIKAESATRRLSQQARDTLLGVGANLYGVIVNAVSKKQNQYGYYSYAYYGSGHGKKEQQS